MCWSILGLHNIELRDYRKCCNSAITDTELNIIPEFLSNYNKMKYYLKKFYYLKKKKILPKKKKLPKKIFYPNFIYFGITLESEILGSQAMAQKHLHLCLFSSKSFRRKIPFSVVVLNLLITTPPLSDCFLFQAPLTLNK